MEFVSAPPPGQGEQGHMMSFDAVRSILLLLLLLLLLSRSRTTIPPLPQPFAAPEA